MWSFASPPIEGSGNVVVGNGSDLTANSIQENSLVIGAGATFTLAPSDADGNPLAAALFSAAPQPAPSLIPSSPTDHIANIPATIASAASPSVSTAAPVAVVAASQVAAVSTAPAIVPPAALTASVGAGASASVAPLVAAATANPPKAHFAEALRKRSLFAAELVVPRTSGVMVRSVNGSPLGNFPAGNQQPPLGSHFAAADDLVTAMRSGKNSAWFAVHPARMHAATDAVFEDGADDFSSKDRSLLDLLAGHLSA